MKNRNSIYQGLSRASIGMLAACMTLTACDKDQEFTPAMPEAKLINGITFKVSENLPLAIGMDSTIVFAIDAPEELEDRSIIWKSTDETVAKVSQQGTITGIAEGTAIISVT
ncbi:Ig domain-containing protein, partial [Bacteroides cellulosilyticus]